MACRERPQGARVYHCISRVGGFDGGSSSLGRGPRLTVVAHAMRERQGESMDSERARKSARGADRACCSAKVCESVRRCV